MRSLMGDVQPIKSPTPAAGFKSGRRLLLPPATGLHPHWDTTVIRGDKVETQSFPLSAKAKQKSEVESEISNSLSEDSIKPRNQNGD